jgi:poly-gamma-glutamate capsule biosynthesis protein CapA/YwtB (metallophosphatase superfamily)
MVETDAGTVAVIGFGEDFGTLMRVSDERPGMAVMRQDRIRSAYFNAQAAGADHVVAFVHWGDNYLPVNRQQKGWAQLFADTGYDLVVGTGPHVVQPVRVVSGMPVAYSIGNYAFGTPGRWVEYGAEGYGIVTTLELTTDGATLQARCVVTDNARANYQPFECPASEAGPVLRSLSPDITIAQGVGTLPLPGFTQSG